MERTDTEKLQGKSIVFYDGTCGFCQASIQLVLKHNERRNLTFAPLQSGVLQALVPAAERPNPLPDAVVFYEEGRLYIASEAVLRIARHLRFPYAALYYFRFIPLSFRNFVYRLVARHRYKIAGRTAACMLPGPEDRARFIA